MSETKMIPVGEIKVMGDVSGAMLIDADGTLMQAAVDRRVAPATAAALADPATTTIVTSAVDARLEEKVGDLDLALRTDPGMPQSVPSSSEYAEVVVGENDIEYGGYLVDGSTYMRKARADSMQLAGARTFAVGDGSSVETVIDPEGRITEPGADGTGRTEQWVIDSWAKRITGETLTTINDGTYERITIDPEGRIVEFDADATGRTRASTVETLRGKVLGAPVTSKTRTVAFWTDSMSADFGNLGSSVAQRVATNLGSVGVTVAALGVIGQRLNEIGIRKGVDLYLALPGNTLPASGSVTVTVITPGPWHPTQPWSYAGAIPGIDGVRYAVTLAKPATNTDQWTLTRSVAGAAVPVVREVRFEATQRADYGEWGQIIWGGRNFPDVATDKATMRLMLETQQAIRPKRIVLPVFNTSAEPSGSAGYATVMALNAAYAELAGPDYWDARRWMIRNGLAAAGITATTQDTADLAADVIPTSLRLDATHLNTIGRNVLADQLSYMMTTERNWLA